MQEELMSEVTGTEEFGKLNEAWMLKREKKCYSELHTKKRRKM